MKIYIVTAYRWGSKESNSYVVGVFDNEELAITQAKNEKDHRSGKYECEVVAMDLNDICKNNREVVYTIDNINNLWKE